MRLILLAACALGACTAQPADQNAAVNKIVATGGGTEKPANPPPVQPIPDTADNHAATPLPPLDSRSSARYKCIDGSRLTAAFDPDNGKVTITRAGKPLVLRQERVASGIRYATDGTSFAGKGESMTFTQPGLPPLPCSPIRR